MIAVSVVLEGGDDATAYAQRLFDDWERWNCGIPLKLLHTDYASVVQPIVAFIDQLRADHPDDQLVVLIPVIRPEKLRYRILHNQLDLVLSSALRGREDIIVARVTVPLEPPQQDPEATAQTEAKPSPEPKPSPSRSRETLTLGLSDPSRRGRASR